MRNNIRVKLNSSLHSRRGLFSRVLIGCLKKMSESKFAADALCLLVNHGN